MIIPKQKVSCLNLERALLAPKVVALVGVSDDETKTSGRPLQYLRRAGFKGTIYNINPRRKRVQGEPAYNSILELPEVPDHAFIITGTEAALDAMKECGKAGVPVVSILATGFSESGPEGVERESRLRAIGRDYGVRILGPSSMGVVNVRENFVLTANAVFAEPDLPIGGAFCVSHSGSLIGALASRGRARNIGFQGLVSVGSEADLSIGEICSATIDNSSITDYILFLESTRHAAELRRFALEAAAHGKPIVAYKLGRSEVAAELAVSHTGALAGEDDIADAFLTDCGIARVNTFEGLLEALPLLRRLPARTDRRTRNVGVVATTGGGAAMVVDQLGIRGVSVVPPNQETLDELRKAGVDVSNGRILDLTMAGTRYEVMKATLDIMQAAPEFDLVLVVVGSSARTRPELAVRPVIDSAGDGKPLACFLTPDAPQALHELTKAGVPNFRTPESCGDVIAAAFSRRMPEPEAPLPLVNQESRVLNEFQAYELFERVGVDHAPATVIDVDRPVPALPFSYPVVVKVADENVTHKTDIGGVVLNVQNKVELKQAIAVIRNKVEATDGSLKCRYVLVQPMVTGLGEALVGFKRDPQVGPTVMLAAGGVLTEIYRDRAIRLAPVTAEGAWEMIAEVKSLKLLSGYRGQTKGDLDALAETVVAVSRLATLDDVRVQEAEVNPVIVLREGQGALAVDALVRLA